MSQRLRVIYIPGVGDAKPTFQRRVVGSWRLWGVEPELFQINWSADISWESRNEALLRHIDTLHAEGKTVALVGASAGGSAAIAAYGARKSSLVGVVTICGKLKNPSDIGPKYRNANPPLLAAVSASDATLKTLSAADKSRILTRRAVFDEVVTTKSDSMVDGAKNQVSPTIFHALTIGLQLIFGAPTFLRFLKRQTVKSTL